MGVAHSSEVSVPAGDQEFPLVALVDGLERMFTVD